MGEFVAVRNVYWICRMCIGYVGQELSIMGSLAGSRSLSCYFDIVLGQNDVTCALLTLELSI